MDSTVEKVYTQFVHNVCTHFWYYKGLLIIDMSKNTSDYTIYHENGKWDIASPTDIVTGNKIK